jgi:hypothetical protein
MRNLKGSGKVEFISLVVFTLGLLHILSAAFVAIFIGNPPLDYVSCSYTSKALLKLDPSSLYQFSIKDGKAVLSEEVVELARGMGYSGELDLPSPYNPLYLVLIMFPFIILPLKVGGILFALFNLFLIFLILYFLRSLIGLNELLLLSGVVLLAYPVKLTMIHGQTHYLLVLLIILTLKYWERENLSGIFTGLSLLHKPFMFLFVIYAILKGRKKYLGYILLTVGIFFAFDVLIWGFDIVRYYVLYMKNRTLWLSSWVGNQSLLSISLGNFAFDGYYIYVPEFHRIIHWIYFSLLCLLGILIVLKREKDFISSFNFLLISGMMVSVALYIPHFMTNLIPSYLFLRRDDVKKWEKIIGSMGMVLIIIPVVKVAPLRFASSHMFLGLTLLWFVSLIYHLRK